IERDAGALKSEIVGVGPPADSEQHVGAQDLRVTMHAIDANAHAGTSFGKSDAFGGGADVDAFSFKNIAHGVGHVWVFAADQPRSHLDHGYLGAKAPIHLGELEADIAAAD